MWYNFLRNMHRKTVSDVLFLCFTFVFIDFFCFHLFTFFLFKSVATSFHVWRQCKKVLVFCCICANQKPFQYKNHSITMPVQERKKKKKNNTKPLMFVWYDYFPVFKMKKNINTILCGKIISHNCVFIFITYKTINTWTLQF